jgi:agmatinase
MPLCDELNGYLRPSRRFFGIRQAEQGLSDVGVLGIPYDLTSSHTPGPRFGPDAIRSATDSERSHSYGLTIGTQQTVDGPLSELITLEDIGDLEVGVQLPESVMYHISSASSILAKASAGLLFLGGDHFITYPIVKGLKRGRPGIYGIVYLDAHADFYEDFGGMTLSHASTLRRLISENIVDRNHAVGYDLRCALPEQRNELGLEACPRSVTAFSESLQRVSDEVDYVYISVDLDVFQPQLVPGVSHPETGGLSFSDMVDILRLCFKTSKVRAADIVEFNPLLDHSQLTSIVARDVVKEILSGFAYQKHYK